MRVNWKTIAQDAEKAEQIEAIAAKIIDTKLPDFMDKNGEEDAGKKRAYALAKKFIEGTDADISSADLEMIATITSEISKDHALAKQAVNAEEKENVCHALAMQSLC